MSYVIKARRLYGDIEEDVYACFLGNKLGWVPEDVDVAEFHFATTALLFIYSRDTFGLVPDSIWLVQKEGQKETYIKPLAMVGV